MSPVRRAVKRVLTSVVIVLTALSAVGLQAVPAGASGVVSDLSVSISGPESPGLIHDGQDNYTITVTNDGPDAADNVEVTFAVDGQIEFGTGTPNDITPCDPSCTIGTLESGASSELYARAFPAPEPGVVNATASVTSSTADPNSANDTDDRTFSFVLMPDLSNFSPQLDHIWIGGPAGGTGPLSCQVNHANTEITDHQWNPSWSQEGFCGTYIYVDATLYGPNGPNLSPPSVQHYDLINQTNRSGDGSDVPYTIETTVAVGDTGLQLVETDRYYVNDESYTTTVSVQNTNEVGDINFTLYRAADCASPFTSQVGRYDPSLGTYGSVACADSGGEGYAGGATQALSPLTPGSHYVEGLVNDLFGDGCGGCSAAPEAPDFTMLSGNDFPDTISDSFSDGGVGLSWSGLVEANSSETYTNEQTFSPYSLQLQASPSPVDPGGTVTYDVAIYPMSSFQDVDAIGVRLPEGFTYEPDHTTGFLPTDELNDIVYDSESNIVTFYGPDNQPFSLDTGGTALTGSFQATAGGAAGTAEVSAWTVVGGSHGAMTGPTAPVDVSGTVEPQPPANLSVTVNQANTPAGFASMAESGLNLAGASLDGGVLAGSAGPQAAPLGKNPLGKNPLGKNPLGKNPLGKNPLGKNPLGKNPLGKNSLNITDPPLRDAPVSTLINRPIANPPLLTSMPISTSGGWASVVPANKSTAPLQTLTLNDAIGGPGWSSLKITDIDWSQTAFSDFSTAAWLLGEATPNSISGQNWAGITSQMGPGCTASMTFVQLQLARCDLTVVPWDQIPLSSITTLSNTPLGYYHLDGILLSYTPLGDILIADAPSVVTCGACGGGTTLADAQEADGISHAKTLKDFTSAQLATVNLDNLLPGMIDVTSYPYEAMTVAQLIAAADTAGQPTIDYTASMDVTCPGADGTTMTVRLPNARFRYVEDSGVFSYGGESTAPAGTPANDRSGNLTFDLPTDVCSTTGLVHVALTITVVPGPNTGTFTAGLTANAPGFDPVSVVHQAPLDVHQAQETGDGLGSATSIEPNTLYTGTIRSSTDQDFFTISLNATDTPPGTRVAVYLSHLSQDDDITLYGPSAASQSLRPAPLGKNPLGKNPLDDNGSCLPQDYSVQPQTLQDVPVVSDPSIAVRGFSTNRSTQEEITCTIVNEQDSGHVTVQVSGFNGASGDQPYVLRYILVPPASSPACQAITFPAAGQPYAGTTPAMPSIPSTTQTLILINAKRFGDTYNTATTNAENQTLTSLNTLANSTLVNGKVIPIETNAAVASAYTALNGDPCSPAKANDVVRSINAFVDNLRTTNNLTDLRFIVLVGSDNIIPMGRVLDLTALGNQSEYQGDARLGSGQDNPISRAFAQGFVLSDDPYGSFTPTPWNGNQLYLPTVSTGRLVETPTEIQNQVSQFLTNNGRLLPAKSLTTGYDFTSDAASQIQSTLTAPPLSLTNQSLISDTWNTTDLLSGLNAGPQVIALNGHFDHYRAQAADGSIVNTAQYLSSGVPQGALLFTLGCNAGVSMPDVWVTSPKTLDWAQAQSQRKGELIGNTGFGYGDDTTVAYSERLMTLYAKNLNGTMSAGQALAVAKSQYYAELAAVGSYDIKAMEESTFYGLPMYRMGAIGTIAGGGTPPTPGAAMAGHTSVTAGAIATDGDTGLAVVNLQVPNFINPTADQRDGSASNKYFVGPNTQVSHYRPIEPVSEPIDMTKANRTLHDGLVTALSVQDFSSFNPQMVLPTIDLASNEPEPLVTDVAFPTDFLATSAVHGPLGRQDFLVIDGGRYVADPNTPGQGTQRVYTSEDVRAFYSNSTDFSRPQYGSVQAFDNGNGSTSFVVDLTPDAAGDRTIAVYVMYRSTGGGPAFTLTRLARGSGDRWTGSVPGSTSEYFVQAVDENGNVGLSTFKGIAQPVTATGSTGTANVQVTGPQASGWYTPGANVKITSATGETFRASVDSGPADPVGPSGIDLTTDGTHVVSYTGSVGSNGTVVVPVDTAAPSFGACPSPGTVYLGSAQSLTISAFDGGIGVDPATSQLTKTLSTSAAGSASVTFTARDLLGHAATKVCSYPVIYKFSGFFQPVDRVNTNIAKAGTTVPVKWQITDDAGVGVSDTTSFTDLTSAKITMGSCTSEPTDPIETYSTGSGLQYLGGGNWQLNWKTPKSYAGQCRTMTLTLKDGTRHDANFQFK